MVLGVAHQAYLLVNLSLILRCGMTNGLFSNMVKLAWLFEKRRESALQIFVNCELWFVSYGFWCLLWGHHKGWLLTVDILHFDSKFHVTSVSMCYIFTSRSTISCQICFWFNSCRVQNAYWNTTYYIQDSSSYIIHKQDCIHFIVVIELKPSRYIDKVLFKHCIFCTKISIILAIKCLFDTATSL